MIDHCMIFLLNQSHGHVPWFRHRFHRLLGHHESQTRKLWSQPWFYVVGVPGLLFWKFSVKCCFIPAYLIFFRSSAFFDDNVYLLLIMRPVVLIGWEKCFSKWVNIIILHNISSEATWWYRLGLTQKLGSWRSYLSLKPGWCSWRRCSWMHMTKQVAMFQGHDKAVAGGRVGSLMITSN